MGTPLYLHLANKLEEMILRRALRPGDRMPSVRQFSAGQRVSVPTALNAYATLEARGLVEARPKSGFYVAAQSVRAVPAVLAAPSPRKVCDLAATDPLELMVSDGHDREKVQLGSAVPESDLLPGARLARIVSAVARRLGAEAGNYEPSGGAPSLRRAIARRSLQWGFTVADPDDVMITNGATEAISLALRATCSPGDTVIVETPTFFGLLRQLREYGLKAMPVPVDPQTGVSLDAVADALARTRPKAMLLVPNYQNPVGSVMPEANRRELVRMAASRNVPIIEDDIYGDLPHRGPRPSCLKAFDRNNDVIFCSSFSKTIAPGYRIGYAVGGRWHQRMLALKKTSTGPNPTLPSLAVAEFLESGGYDRFLRLLRERCRQQMQAMREAVAASFSPGIRLTRPEGGFILWCELPAKVDSLELFHRARAAGVTVAPGALFSPDGGFRNFIRINCGLRWTPRVERAVATLGQLARQLEGAGPAHRDF